MATRRTFLSASALAAGALTMGPLGLVARTSAQPGASKSLRILILGGTGFIGPHQVRHALARGHQVTLFNRGRTNPALFKGLRGIEERIGDRAPSPGNYGALTSGEWDVVIDNPATRPRWVREAAAALKGRVGQYVFISTMSAYAAHDTPGADESAALATTTTPDVEDGPTYASLYGPLKALAEREAQQAFGARATIIRPGLVVGAGDATDRFTYWPVRIARGGAVLAPPADHPVQFIDARDLGEWVIRCCEQQRYGVFNAVGPASRFTVRQMLESTREALGASATFTYVTGAFLGAQKVVPYTDMPVWIPPVGAVAGIMERSIAKAVAQGLTFRPFADTVKETMTFYQQQSDARKAELRAGLTAEREAALLAAWARASSPR